MVILQTPKVSKKFFFLLGQVHHYHQPLTLFVNLFAIAVTIEDKVLDHSFGKLPLSAFRKGATRFTKQKGLKL